MTDKYGALVERWLAVENRSTWRKGCPTSTSSTTYFA